MQLLAKFRKRGSFLVFGGKFQPFLDGLLDPISLGQLLDEPLVLALGLPLVLLDLAEVVGVLQFVVLLLHEVVDENVE